MSENNLKNPSYKVINGITYFKLKSEYPGDYTKNCGLLGEEIDANFYFLRSNDIKEMTIDNNGILKLIRVDGEKLESEVPVNNYKFEYDRKSGKLIITRPNGEIDIVEGFVINGDVRVATDETFYGKGTEISPFGLSPLEKTGTYAPANMYLDFTFRKYYKKVCHIEEPLYVGGEEIKWYSYDEIPELPKGAYAEEMAYVPESSMITFESPLYIYVLEINEEKLPKNPGKGYRVVTKEIEDNFGLLYQYDAVKLISNKLYEKKSKWRVPTKEDWDGLLNAAEYCNEDRNHNTTEINEFTGKHAGARAKSITLWRHSDKREDGYPVGGEDSLPVTGNRTFKVLPIGYGEGTRGLTDNDVDIEGFRKSSSYWSSSEVCCSNGTPNIYTRSFFFDTRKVLQESSKPSSRLSIRLVKDFDCNTHMEEYDNILGYKIPCVLISNEETKYSKIWTSINVGFKEPILSGVTSREWAMSTSEERGKYEKFFINEWSGTEWIKKQMKEGDSIVLISGMTDNSGVTIYNHEWRVYSGVTADRVVFRDVAEVMKEECDKEFERIDKRIDEEISARTIADEFLTSAITAEEYERMADISGLTIEEVPANNLEPQVKVAYKLVDRHGNQHGEYIKIYKDEKIKEITTDSYSGHTVDEDGNIIRLPEAIPCDVLIIVYKNDIGQYKLVEINLDELFDLNAGNGIEFKDGKIHVKIDQSSDDYLSVSKEGVLLTGVAESFSALTKALEEETSERMDADSALTMALDEETSERIAADSALTVALDEETSERIAADSALTIALDEETSERMDADSAITKALEEETSERMDADSAITKALEEETIERIEGDTSLMKSIEKETSKRISGDTNIAKLLGISGSSENGFVVEFTRPYYQLIYWPTTATTFKDMDHVPEYQEICEKGYWDFKNYKAKPDFEYIENTASTEDYRFYQLIPGTNYISSAKTYVEAIQILDNILWLLDKTPEIISAITENIRELSGATMQIESALTVEIDRAIATEELIDSRIDSEIERAISAETSLSGSVYELSASTIAEIERAISVETSLSGSVYELSASTIAEIERAKTKEEELHGQDIKSGPYEMTVDGVILERENGDTIGIFFDGNFGTI